MIYKKITFFIGAILLVVSFSSESYSQSIFDLIEMRSERTQTECLGLIYEQKIPDDTIEIPNLVLSAPDTVFSGERFKVIAETTVDTEKGGEPSIYWCVDRGKLVTYRQNTHEIIIEAPFFPGTEMPLTIQATLSDSLGNIVNDIIVVKVKGPLTTKTSSIDGLLETGTVISKNLNLGSFNNQFVGLMFQLKEGEGEIDFLLQNNENYIVFEKFCNEKEKYYFLFQKEDIVVNILCYNAVQLCRFEISVWTEGSTPVDMDHDDIPDSWEERTVGSLKLSDSTDFDNDGILDIDEYHLGFDPAVDDRTIDSDGDGHSNYDEHLAGTDPFNPDDHPTCRFSVPTFYPTIQSAIDAAHATWGGTVCVAEGTYPEHLTLQNNIWLIADGQPENTIIQGEGNKDVITVKDCDSGGIIGFTVTSSGANGNFAGIDINGNDDEPVIAKCIIKGNNNGIVIDGNADPVIANNDITDNTGAGIVINGNSEADIYNNIITGNQEEGIRNNGQLSDQINYNDIWNNNLGDNNPQEESYENTGTGNISQDPLFEDAVAGDYHLTASSPCIDTGNPVVLDKDGTRSDMGVYGGSVTLPIFPKIVDTFASGIFTVGDTGKVTFDFLFDGGGYKGQVAAFNIDGMEQYIPNSEEFVEEALRRALSGDPDQGFVAISDPDEGARFSGYLGDIHDFNQGPYKGIKEFEMTPGTQFAVYLVPNGTVEQVFQNPGTADPKLRPLFSLASSNADHNMYMGQVADLFGTDRAFAYEDLVFSNSDFDFDDVIFYVEGATCSIPSLDELIAQDVVPSRPAWLDTDLGQQMGEHANMPPAGPEDVRFTIRVSVSVDITVTAPGGGFIGMGRGGTIPGATIRLDLQGNQLICLPPLANGDYEIIIGGTGDNDIFMTRQTGDGTVLESHSATLRLDENPMCAITLPATKDDSLPPMNARPVNSVITVTNGTYGKISPAGPVTVTDGANQTFVITPDPHCTIKDVVVDGQSKGAVSEYTFENVSEPHTIRALFEIETVNVTITRQGNGFGDLSETSQSVPYGSDLVVAATPAAGSIFMGWSGDAGGDGYAVLADITEDKEIIATFALETPSGKVVSATADDCAAIDPAGDVLIAENDDGGFTITPPADDCHSYDVLINGDSQGQITEYPFANLADGDTIAVVCIEKRFTVTVQAGGSGGGSLPFTQKEIACGGSLSITATPDANSVFGGWSGDFTGATMTAELADIRENMTLIALFNPKGSPTPQPTPNPGTNNAPNIVPTAHAGDDMTVLTGALVTLDGAESEDPDGTITAFNWAQTDGETPVTLKDADASAASFTAPEQDGVLIFTLTVTDDDGAESMDEIIVTVLSENLPPTANAGVDQTVAEGETVTLSAANSSDPDDGIAEYLWQQIQGDDVQLSDPSSPQPTFIAPQVDLDGASLKFELFVFDGAGQNSGATVIVNVTDVRVNEPPVAVAGENQEVMEGSETTLAGGESHDPDGDAIAFAWTQLSGPAVALSDAANAAPTFVAPQVDENGETLTFELTVTDAGGLQSKATTMVTVTRANDPPVANAGESRTVTEGDTVALDASGSFDSDGRIAAYLWTQTHGEHATLSDPAAARPTFVTPAVDAEGAVLVFALTVTDDGGLKSDAAVEIVVADNGITDFPNDPDAVTTETDGGEPIGVNTDDNGELVGLEIEPSPETPDENAPETMPIGMIDMVIKTALKGATVEVTILLSIPVEDHETWFALDPDNGFTDIRDLVSFFDGRTRSLIRLTDGGEGDQDGVADGRIRLRAVLGSGKDRTNGTDETDGEDNGGGGSTCFIASTADGPCAEGLSEIALLIVLFIGFGLCYRRR